MYPKLYLFIFFTLVQQSVHASQVKLFLSPHGSYGASYDIEEGNDKRISSKLGYGPIVDLHLTTKIGIAVIDSYFLDYEKLGVNAYQGGSRDLVGKYSPYALKKRLLSRDLQVYGQAGLWWARVLVLTIEKNQKRLVYQGGGFAVGFGVNYELWHRTSLDVSWRKLIDVPFFSNSESLSIQGGHRINIGVKINLIDFSKDGEKLFSYFKKSEVLKSDQSRIALNQV